MAVAVAMVVADVKAAAAAAAADATRANAVNASRAGRRIARNTESGKGELHWRVDQILSSRNVKKSSRASKSDRIRPLAKSAAKQARIPAGAAPPSRRWTPAI